MHDRLTDADLVSRDYVSPDEVTLHWTGTAGRDIYRASVA